MIYQYRELEEGEFIVIGADPAEGGDNSTFVAISKKYADVVLVSKSKEESTQLGHSLNYVGRWIEKQTGIFPQIAPERNVGTSTIVKLKELNYPNLFKMPSSFIKDQAESTDYGWVTSSVTRPMMLDDLAVAIRQGVLKIPSKLIIDELYTFIRHPKTGKPQADSSSHDDLVMALAIAWQVYQIASPVEQKHNYAVAARNQDMIDKWSMG